MTEPELPPPSLLNRVAQLLGLAHPDEGRPGPGSPRRSRYGLYVSPRLDQDLDELRARVAELEARE